MKMSYGSRSFVVSSLVTVLLAGSLASCGTILYPDRNGQKAGDIDPLVAVLDGVGLLFFIIPGVIAFAVDFNNHSIYLPHGHAARASAALDDGAIRIDGKLDRATIERRVFAATGEHVDLSKANVRVLRLQSTADIDTAFARYDGAARVAMAR